MPKRSQRVQDEEDEEVHVSSGKRARTVDSEDDEGPPQTRQRRGPNGTQKKNKGKGRARAVPEEDEDEDEDVAMSDAEPAEMSTADLKMDDEEFESTYGPQVRDAIDKMKNRPNGAVAEHGIIEYIEMHQFMCHVYLSFTFGPQINFIIGHNGSGKSAVLSAITVALGGKSTSTGRGTGLKSFIREGQQASEVSIHIKNQGDEAFKPKEYGDSIVVTRRFNKNGGSSWEIKSKAGKVISKKQEELAAICDHMNIQVDNPMTVLTQDSARQFLSASAPADKYKFFLSGTQLSQLSEEYEACMANINATGKLLAVKKEALPDLEARLREATARYEEADKARVQRERLDDLKRESAWSLVADKKAELTKQIEEVAKCTSKLAKIDRDYQKAIADVEAASDNVRALELQLNELGEVQELVAQKASLAAEIRANKSKVQDLNSQRRDINNTVAQLDQQIAGLKEQVAAETQKVATKTQAVIERRQEAMKVARDQQNFAQAELDRIIHERVELGKQADSLMAQGMEQDRTLLGLQNSIQECDSMINSARQHDKDALVPYGNNIKQVLEEVHSSRWYGEVPIGPLGTYVKAREPEKWGQILRNQLGSSLVAFAVTDVRDREQLSKILHKYKNPNVQIIISERDLFDYRGGEPREGVLTVLRALEVSDQFVLRILINQNRIESQVLSETRREAERLLRELGGGSAFTLDRFNVRVFPEGGSASNPLNLRNLRGSMNLLLTGRDTQSEIQHYEYERQKLSAQYNELRASIENAKHQYHGLKAQIEKMNHQERNLNNQIRHAKQTFNTLQQEANEDMPVDITGLYGAIDEAEAEKANILLQFAELEQQRQHVNDTQTQLQTALNDVKRQVDEHEGKRSAILTQIEEAITLRVKAQHARDHWKVKQESEKAALVVVQANADVLQIEFTDWSAKAEEFCDPFENPRKYDVVQRHIESVSKALKERERRQGASVEELAREVNKAKENYDHTKQELRQMHQLNRALKDSLLVRLVRWQEFRRHIALRCKAVFQYHLSQRGYYGKILFDHEHQTLTLRVQTDDQLTSGNKDKDPKSLSGGEKSFSTICLLLALWESIGCPLRCLDEFDVFMDAVNRRISMKMMIDTANTSDKKQYVLITPQEMTNITLGPSVKVHKMADPERGGVNGRLNFAS